MIPVPQRDLEREIAKSLVAALEMVLTAGGASAELRAARDAAQLLELPGLDRLIAALAPHATRPWPAEIGPVVERLLRVCARAATEEGLAGFRRSDADFRRLADEIVAMEWGTLPPHGGAPGPSVATIRAAEMLSDLALADESSASVARRVRLSMPVAAAVRAALDWLAGREGVRRPLELREDASAFEIVYELRDAQGVPPAHDVLSGVDGNLGPPLTLSGEPREGAWIIRVPAFSERPAYAMLEQGSLRIAVPWHAVLKLQVTPREMTRSRAARLGMSVLDPLSPLEARGSECPVVIVAHGLKRGWIVADRLVWRLPAEACEPDERVQQAGLRGAVRTEDGEVFGLVEPRRLLEGTPLPPLPRVAAREAAAPEARTQAERPVAAVPPTPASPAAPSAIEVLDERWVTPLPAPAAPPVAAPTPAAHTPAKAPLAPTPAAHTPSKAPAAAASGPPREPAPGWISAHESVRQTGVARRVLVAEDSITVRIFFTRLLEQQGFEVVSVERAAALEAALAAGPWSLACVDVELPDALGAGLLSGVRERLPDETPLVALVRDDHDVIVARAAGVWRTLLKPVEPEALRRLLARLGLLERAS